MGKSDPIKKKMNKRLTKKIFKEISFQPYIDSIKERKLPWNIFEQLVDDLSDTDDMERIKNLNKILMNELKNSVENKRNKSEMIENENAPKSFKILDEHNLNDKIIGKKSIEKNVENFHVEKQEIVHEELKNELKNSIENKKQKEIIENEYFQNLVIVEKHCPNDEMIEEKAITMEEEWEENSCIEMIHEEEKYDFKSSIESKKHPLKIIGNGNSQKSEDKIIEEESILIDKGRVEDSHIEMVLEEHDLNSSIENENEKKKHNKNENVNEKLMILVENSHNEVIHEELKSAFSNKLSCNKDSKCEFCGKSYFDAGTLRRHIRTIHEGHKYYQCKSCDKPFIRAECLKKHIQTVHEGYKYYICDSCGKSFSTTENLKNHISYVHERCKDFKCEFCEKPFSCATYLKQHISTVHEDKRALRKIIF